MPEVERRMKDHEAHARIDRIESVVEKHFEDHARFETALEANTALTQTIADNTSELVMLVKGAKIGRRFLVWITPIIVAAIAMWEWMRK
jgi:hypothetical protein